MKKRTITSVKELILLLELGASVKDKWINKLGTPVPSTDIRFLTQRRERDLVDRWLARGDYYVEEE